MIFSNIFRLYNHFIYLYDFKLNPYTYIEKREKLKYVHGIYLVENISKFQYKIIHNTKMHTLRFIHKISESKINDNVLYVFHDLQFYS